jgi:hypothetical protein
MQNYFKADGMKFHCILWIDLSMKTMEIMAMPANHNDFEVFIKANQ